MQTNYHEDLRHKKLSFMLILFIMIVASAALFIMFLAALQTNDKYHYQQEINDNSIKTASYDN